MISLGVLFASGPLKGNGMTDRIVGYDVARAFAIFGMVLVNYKIAMNAQQNGPAWLVDLAGLVDGRAAALFVVLAGVGISLLSQAGRVAQDPERIARDRRTLLRRSLFLFVVGALYTSIYFADILHFYGIYIAVAALMLTTSVRRLWMSSAGLVLLFVALCLVLDYERGWDWKTLEYEGMWTPTGAFRHLFFNGFHPVVPWLGFLFTGMVIGRQDTGDGTVRRRVFAWGLGVALVAECVSRVLLHVLLRDTAADEAEVIVAFFGTGPMPPLPLYMLAAGGTASAIIAASVALGQRYGRKPWLRPLVATGQLALTLYVAHVLAGMAILEAVGRLENQTLPFALLAAAVFCAAGVAFASVWRGRFKRGPLEAIMRALTDPRVARAE